jgi:hypothetical protein
LDIKYIWKIIIITMIIIISGNIGLTPKCCMKGNGMSPHKKAVEYKNPISPIIKTKGDINFLKCPFDVCNAIGVCFFCLYAKYTEYMPRSKLNMPRSKLNNDEIIKKMSNKSRFGKCIQSLRQNCHQLSDLASSCNILQDSCDISRVLGHRPTPGPKAAMLIYRLYPLIKIASPDSCLSFLPVSLRAHHISP